MICRVTVLSIGYNRQYDSHAATIYQGGHGIPFFKIPAYFTKSRFPFFIRPIYKYKPEFPEIALYIIATSHLLCCIKILSKLQVFIIQFLQLFILFTHQDDGNAKELITA